MSSQTKKLSGKVAVVTGASKGIGAAIAESLGAEGATVIVNYASSREGADRVVSQITAKGGKAIAVQGDVSKEQDVVRVFSEVKKSVGKVDILVNNAGVYEFGPIESITEESFQRQFGVNVLGLLLTTREAVKLIGSEGGSIVNISSVVSTRTPPNSAIYTGTKGAVDSITKVLANELAPRKIRVNSINPGLIATDGAASTGILGSDFEKGYVSMAPLARIGQTDDIAPTAVYLASADSKFMTGESLIVSGGVR